MVGVGGCACTVRGEFGDQAVAVKFLAGDMFTLTAGRLLEQEAHLLSLVNRPRHPNVLRLIGAWFSHGTRGPKLSPLMVTELLDMDLRQLYEQTHIQRSSMLSIFIDIAYGLCYLHGRLIIHRDINPSNIFLKKIPCDGVGCGDSWRAKIGDFGSASLLSSAGSSVSLGGGTPLFAAPETLPSTQTQPQSGSVCITVRADVYSYGMLLVEVVMGTVPEEKSYVRLVEGLGRRWKSLHSLVERCTQQEARRRPTASQIVDTLENAVWTGLGKQ